MKNRYIPISMAFALLCTTLTAGEDPKLLFLRAREMQQGSENNGTVAAIALYRKVIKALPDSAEAHLRLSEALLETHDIDGALAAAKNAATLAPKNAEAAANLAIIEFAIAKQSGQNAEVAKASLGRAARLSPGDPELWFRLADLCESTQDALGALNAWLRLGGLRPPMLLGNQPVYIVAYERAAYLSYTLKRYKERREACLALVREPNAPEHHLRWLEELAREQVEQGYLGHAEESFALLAKRLPEEPSVWQNIALVQRQSEHFSEAIESLQKANEIKPEPRNIIQQAYCLMSTGRLEEAYSILHDLYNKPDSPEYAESRDYARSLYSVCLLLQNRPDDLLQIMKSWNDISENIFLSSQRAQALIKANDFKSARIALKEGMQRFPSQLMFRRASSIPESVLEGGSGMENESRKAIRLLDIEATAYLWAEFKQWDKCLEAIREIHRISPIKDVELLLLQSNAHESLGQKENALELLRQCQRLSPDHSIVQNNLGYHLLETGGDIEEAAVLIRAALDQEPDNASYLDSWAWVLFRQGKYEEAETILQKAVEVNPLSPEIRKHLGEVLLKLDRPQEALEQWETALAFIFPDRKKIENQAGSLKTELAKKALSENESESDDDVEHEDEW